MGQGTSQHLTTVKDALSPNVTYWDVPFPMSHAPVKRPTDVTIPQVCEYPDSGGHDASRQSFCKLLRVLMTSPSMPQRRAVSAPTGIPAMPHRRSSYACFSTPHPTRRPP